MIYEILFCSIHQHDDSSFVRHDIPSPWWHAFRLSCSAQHRIAWWHVLRSTFHLASIDDIFLLLHTPSHRNDGMFLFPAWLVTSAAELWLMNGFYWTADDIRRAYRAIKCFPIKLLLTWCLINLFLVTWMLRKMLLQRMWIKCSACSRQFVNAFCSLRHSRGLYWEYITILLSGSIRKEYTCLRNLLVQGLWFVLWVGSANWRIWLWR